MRYLGIDYGAKRVGIAISDENQTMAFPKETLVNNDQLISRIIKIVQDESVTSIVVGDTRAFSGLENPVTKEAEDFVARLRKNSSMPVEWGWEAGSSVEVSRFAPKGEEHNDAAAAALILQRFLEMKKSGVE